MSLLYEIWQLLGFIAVQYTLGRRGSYPYGLLIRYSLVQISMLIILCDAIQTFILLTFFNRLVRLSPWLSKRFDNKRRKREALPPTHWRKRLYNHRFPAMVFIAALPYGGGALSGALFALSTDSQKPRAFLFILLGCILGTLIYHVSISGLF